jgi:CheY-like chemotaxis protein
MAIPGVGSGLRVLVVDDDVDTVESTSLLFRMQGHDAKTACNGPEAIECAKAFRPHLILLDIGMPKMNGYEVARELRRSASAEQSMIVAITGYAYPADKRRCAEAGFDLHVAKPVDFDVLEQLIWLSRDPDRLREDSRQPARRQTSPSAMFIGTAIDTGNPSLDVAINAQDPSLNKSALAKAQEIQGTITELVGNRPNERSNVVSV